MASRPELLGGRVYLKGRIVYLALFQERTLLKSRSVDSLGVVDLSTSRVGSLYHRDFIATLLGYKGRQARCSCIAAVPVRLEENAVSDGAQPAPA